MQQRKSFPRLVKSFLFKYLIVGCAQKIFFTNYMLLIVTNLLNYLLNCKNKYIYRCKF